MYKKTIISCGVAALMALASAPAFAQGLELSTSNREGRTPQGELAPSSGPPPVPAGDAWVGLETITEADLVAAGVQLVPDAAGPDPLSPETAARIAEEGAESIINWDSRMRTHTADYPNRAIVYITRGGSHHCTGWMISKNVVATAGHCLHTGGSFGDWYTSSDLVIYPGRDGASSPWGSCTGVTSYSNSGWTVDGNSQDDYGALVVNCNVGDTVGWFGIYHKKGADAFKGESAIISGYPGDKPQGQWASSDQIRVSTWKRVCYRMDTIGGHSGSPIWNDRKKGLDTTGAWAFAVHAYAANCANQMNWAPRINAQRRNLYTSWINAHQ